MYFYVVAGTVEMVLEMDGERSKHNHDGMVSEFLLVLEVSSIIERVNVYAWYFAKFG